MISEALDASDEFLDANQSQSFWTKPGDGWRENVFEIVVTDKSRGILNIDYSFNGELGVERVMLLEN